MESRQGNHERMRELFRQAVKADPRSAHALQVREEESRGARWGRGEREGGE